MKKKTNKHPNRLSPFSQPPAVPFGWQQHSNRGTGWWQTWKTRNLFINASPHSRLFHLRFHPFPEKILAATFHLWKGNIHFWSRPWSRRSRWVHFEVFMSESPATSKLRLVLGKILFTDVADCLSHTWLELQLGPKWTISLYGAPVLFWVRDSSQPGAER